TGIYWIKNTQKWNVRLTIDGQRKSFGCYDDEIEAAKVYDALVKEHRGEYAVLNFPEKRAKKRPFPNRR
ncbi:MAG: AP2/ERF family transcription factor, partial [Planctomycetota bacterium]